MFGVLNFNVQRLLKWWIFPNWHIPEFIFWNNCCHCPKDNHSQSIHCRSPRKSRSKGDFWTLVKAKKQLCVCKLRRKLAYLQLDSKMVTSRFVSQRGKLRTSQLRVKPRKRVSIKHARAGDSLCFQRCHPFKPFVVFKSTPDNGDLVSVLLGRSAPSALLRICDFAR